MNQPVKQPQLEFTLTVLNGPNKGAVYRLVSEKVTIGRDPDNDIIIDNDPKCSRKHAVLSFSPKGIKLFDVTKNNKITVDGSKGKVRPVRNKSVIEVGQTKFQFHVHEGGISQLPAHAPKHLDQASLGASTPPSTGRRQKKKGLDPIVLVTAVGLLILALFFSGGGKDKVKELDPSVKEDVEVRIALQEKRNQELQEQKRKAGIYSQQYRMAQSLYIQGFRDYKKGQYERAYDAFVGCLTAYSDHVLCNKYRNLSLKKLKELMQYNLVLGRKYRDQNQFKACVSALNNVIVMASKNNDQVVIKEAQALRKECLERLETIY